VDRHIAVRAAALSRPVRPVPHRRSRAHDRGVKRTAPPLAVVAALPILLAVAPGSAPPAESLCELQQADRARAGARGCLACHDGSIASGQMARAHEGGSGAHPVDVDYHLSHARRPDAFHAPAALPANLRLVDGKVTCTTCHDGSSSERGKPAVTMRGSAMCFSCHDV
jgi:predicted CXXCH cytochrome family protein